MAERKSTPASRGIQSKGVVPNASLNFDDPIYLSASNVLENSASFLQEQLKPSKSIYDDLSDLLGKPPEPPVRKRDMADDKSETERESVYLNAMAVGVVSDSSSDDEETVPGPSVVKQLSSSANGEKSGELVLRWKGSSPVPPDTGKSYEIGDHLGSPDFEDSYMPAAMLGKDGFAPLTVNNPFFPQSSTLLPAANRQELEDSLRNFADSLVRTSRAGDEVVSPPLSPPVLRPPMLPPLHPNASTDEKKRWMVLEQLLMSESALIISLTTAIDSYMKPLHEAIKSHNPILDIKSVLHLFGPVENVLEQHKLFYLAITQIALDWNKESTIGNIFTSCFTRKPAIKAYRQFVINFPVAMETMERAISKKPKFLTFLKERLQVDPTRLTLQGLLTKPIQRFPQYLMFLQDFLKHTPDRHPDKVSLQLALSHFESIAEHLDEAKKDQYHEGFVTKLKLRGLPYKIGDLKGQLIRKEEVVKLVFNGENVIRKKRVLLLFNNKLVCAKEKEKNEGSTSSSSIKEGMGIGDAKFVSRWVVNLYAVDAVEPDYELQAGVPEQDEYEAVCKLLRLEHQELQHDLRTMTDIIGGLGGLKKTYCGLDIKQFHSYLKALQTMLLKNEAMIRQYEGGRLDISIPSKEVGSGKVRRTYSFTSEASKLRFVEEMRHAKLRGKVENKPTWMVSQDHLDEDEMLQPRSRSLPLYVQPIKCQLKFNSINMSTDCAVHTGLNRVWMASGSGATSQIAVLKCTTNSQKMTDCFPVEHRVLSMVYVPGTERRQDGQGTRDAPTVWVGCQDGHLLVYSAAPGKDKMCLYKCTLPDPVTCMVYTNRKVFAGTAVGQAIVFQKDRTAKTWDLEKHCSIQLKPGVVKCGCMVKPFLWLGNMNFICVVNTRTEKIQTYISVGKDATQSVKKIVPIGAGVWVCLRRSLKIILLHKTTHQVLQELSIALGITPILKGTGVHQYVQMTNATVSSLLATPGYLWVGLSNGLIVIYRIPRLEGIPAIMSYPFLAQDCHEDSVRVMIYVNTSASLEKEQLVRFIEDTEEEYGSFVQSDLDSQVQDLTLRLNETLSGDRSLTSTSSSFSLLPNQEPSEDEPIRKITAESLLRDTLDLSFGSDSALGDSDSTDAGRMSRQISLQPTKQESSDDVRREEDMRKDIEKTVECYRSQFNYADYETLGKYRYAKPLLGDEITAEDLYAPVDPSELTMNYKASSNPGEQSVHFILTGARGLRNIAQFLKRTKDETIQPVAGNSSVINVFEIPNIQ